MTAAIELRDAFRIYQSESGTTAALQGLDLSLEPGEVVVVLGPSGAGKSTLLRVLAGLDHLSAGTARAFDVDLGRLDRASAAAFRAAYVGLLDQHYARSLSADLTCRHSVALQLELAGASPQRGRDRAALLLDRVGLLDRADEYPDRLSGGEQQRVALCAAVAHEPRLLLADEPAGELDADNAARVYGLLGELVRQVGATAVIVSHDATAATIADRLVYIRDGRIVEQAQPGQEPRLVISRKGWVRLPQRRLDGPGEARLADVSCESGRIVLEPVTSDRAAGEAPVGRALLGVQAGAPPGPIRAELDGVGKSYPSPRGQQAIFGGVTHSFRAGTLTGVIGRSGSGKTTLLHVLAGLERPTAGRVSVLGDDLAARSRAELARLRRDAVALVTQEPGLIPYLTALENVELGIRLRSAAPGQARAEEALRQVGLDERRHHRASDLSAGERERVAIARALAADTAMWDPLESTCRHASLSIL